MREVQDYFTISVERIYEDAGQTTKAGIIKLNETWIDPEEEKRFVYKRLHGTVVSGPLGFSNQATGDFIPVGIPEPKAYVSHDHISNYHQRGYKNFSRDDYHAGTFEGYEMITLADYAKRVNVKQGDKVYFMETVTESENFLGHYGDKSMLFRCRVDQIICSVRDGQIIMQGTWVLVDPVMESWGEITTETGIITKVAPEGKPLRAHVRHIQADDSNEPGDQIFYLPDSNWGITVEGKEYFGIREKEIILTVK